MPIVELGCTFELAIEQIDDAPVYLRAIWKNIKAQGLTSNDALVSIAVGSDAAAPDYVLREVMEGTVLDNQGTMSLGCYSGRTHKWNRRHSLPEHETDDITLEQLKLLLEKSIKSASTPKL